MEQDISIVIRDDGNVVCLDKPETQCFHSLGSYSSRRASHVEPDFLPLRFLFHLLRFIFGDKEQSRMANFTRRWKCLWRVNTKPVGGPVLGGRWRTRKEAIDAEIQFLNSFLT